MTVWPIYGAASVLAIGLAAMADKDERYDRLVMALILFMGWCAANLMHMAHISATYPLIDLLICYSAFIMMMDGAKPWKYVVFGALLCQLVLHAAYQAALLFNLYLGYYYLAALNALFVCQLVAVSARGAKRGFDDWMGKPRIVRGISRLRPSRVAARLNDDGTRPRS